MNWVAPIKDEKTLQDFSELLKQTDLKYYIMFQIGIGTGLLLQDILLLKISDLKDKDSLEVTIGARKNKRTFEFDDELKEAIKEYSKEKQDSDYLMSTVANPKTPISREQAYRVLRNCGSKIGVSSIGAQTMRKTFAWKYYQKTKDIYYLQDLFCHASPSITYRFIGEKPNVSVVLHKMTANENERSRYLLFLNNSGSSRLTRIINELTDIKDNFDNPGNNDSFYGKVDCLLQEIEVLMDTFNSQK